MAHTEDELDDNPVLIQSFRKRATSSPYHPAPLVLFHDGGGTPFNYFLLKPLGRDVFGFADPRAPAQQPWSGGVDEMARYYLECMTTAVKPGPVLLGGKCPVALFAGEHCWTFLVLLDALNIDKLNDRVVLRRNSRCSSGAPDLRGRPGGQVQCCRYRPH